MKQEIFSVYDSAAQAFLQPFFSPSLGSALRSLTDAVNDPKHEFSKHAGDYTLFKLGSFSDDTGLFDTAPPEQITTCLALIIQGN